MPLERWRHWMALASRFGAPIVGGYVFTYGFVAFAALAGFWLGLSFTESKTLAWMLSLVVYLVAILWGFAARSVTFVWVVLAGGGIAMSFAAWALSREII